jgi:hypothetical protein
MLREAILAAKRRKLQQHVSDVSAATSVSLGPAGALPPPVPQPASAGPGDASEEEEEKGGSSQGSNFLIARLLGSSAASSSACQLPTPSPAAAWWGKPMLDSIAHKFESCMHRLTRNLVVSESCAGLGSIGIGARALRLPVMLSAANDKKECSRTWLCAGQCGHVFDSMADHGQACDDVGGAFCHRHGALCCTARGGDDCMFLGPPCQAFSGFRSKKSVQTMEHKSVATVLGSINDDSSVVSMLNRVRPKSFVLENVTQFISHVGQDRPPIVLFQEQLQMVHDSNGQPLYKYLHVFEMQPEPFLKISRPRTVPAASALLARVFAQTCQHPT